MYHGQSSGTQRINPQTWRGSTALATSARQLSQRTSSRKGRRGYRLVFRSTRPFPESIVVSSNTDSWRGCLGSKYVVGSSSCCQHNGHHQVLQLVEAWSVSGLPALPQGTSSNVVFVHAQWCKSEATYTVFTVPVPRALSLQEESGGQTSKTPDPKRMLACGLCCIQSCALLMMNTTFCLGMCGCLGMLCSFLRSLIGASGVGPCALRICCLRTTFNPKPSEGMNPKQALNLEPV